LNSIIVLPHLPGTLAVTTIRASLVLVLDPPNCRNYKNANPNLSPSANLKMNPKPKPRGSSILDALQMRFSRSREREREPTVAFGQVNNESKAKKTRSGMFLNNGIAKMNDRTRWRGTDISQTFEPGLRAGQIRTATISRAKMGAGIKGA